MSDPTAPTPGTPSFPPTYTPDAVRVRSLTRTAMLLVGIVLVVGGLFYWLQIRQDRKAMDKRERAKAHVILRPNEEVHDWRLKEGARIEELATVIERQRRDMSELQTQVDELRKRLKKPSERDQGLDSPGRGASPDRRQRGAGAAIPPLPPLSEILPPGPSRPDNDRGDKPTVTPRLASKQRTPANGTAFGPRPKDEPKDEHDSLDNDRDGTATGSSAPTAPRSMDHLFAHARTDKSSRIADTPRAEERTPRRPPSPSSQPSHTPPASPSTGSRLRVITPAASPGRADRKAAQAVGWLPSGSFVHATLLSGIDASTGTGSSLPYPVLMRLTDPSILPNHFQMDLADCFIVGAAWGDLPSERVYIRSENLSCIRRHSSALATVDGELKGQVMGEDGKLGIRGRVVSKEGTIIARSLWGSFLSGLSQAFRPRINFAPLQLGGTDATSNRAFELPPVQDTLTAAGISGVGKSAELLAQFYLKQAQNLYPVIEISSGRPVDLVILKGMPLKFNVQVQNKAGESAGQQEVID